MAATDGDPRDEIARLEERIEELADTIESCRKLILMAKIAIAGGALAMLAILFGALRFDLVILTAAMAAFLGGIVLFGSNTSTAKQALAEIKQAERARAELIDRLELRVIHGGAGPH